ncbi:MAG TPA: bifunctional helix-turn-helix transcriptional regulator/GNAT family N-acetyltransferase [Gammaproteobacteria bacterium]
MKPTPFDATGLGSRLRRVSQWMLADVDRAYAAESLSFRTRLFPVMYALHREQTLSVGELAAISGFTQPAISQTVRQLERSGHVSVATGRDARNRRVSLTPAGHELVETLQPFWKKARQAVETLLSEVTPDFMAALDSLEAALERQSMFERLSSAPPPSRGEELEILPFAAAYKAAFRDLNLEWVETHFFVEDYDREQLENPERILDAGGEIWFARLGDEIVGTGALYCHGEGSYEIAKMAVSPRIRGRGIGRQLMNRLIQRFRERGGKRLRLETNSRLEAAITLYRSVGFVDHVPEQPSRYARANVFMEWKGDK